MVLKVGDTVLYHGGAHEKFNGGLSTPAIVTRVWEENYVNLHIFKDAGGSESRTSVRRKGTEPDGAPSFEHPIP